MSSHIHILSLSLTRSSMAAINYNFRYASRYFQTLTGTLRSHVMLIRSLQLRCQNFHNFVSEISILISERERKVFFALWPLNKILTKCYHALTADQLFMHTLHVELSLARGLQAFKLIHSLVDNIAVHFSFSLPLPLDSIKLNLLCLFFFLFLLFTIKYV